MTCPYYSAVAQWWSNRLLTGRLQVRVLSAEPWIGVRVAEGARLEIVCAVISRTVGSNPTLSAINAPVAQ
ncbi:hypothetical protein CULT_160014 [[Clostridium] ultunense Esp]|nr:hypothetical protein CULT_160014 [[Clostridium] ultunense Esp]